MLPRNRTWGNDADFIFALLDFFVSSVGLNANMKTEYFKTAWSFLSGLGALCHTFILKLLSYGLFSKKKKKPF